MAHTPGPWDDASQHQGVDSVRIFAKTHYIATVGNSDDPREVTEANARLIAAAPELLAVLKIARRSFFKCMTTNGTDPEYATLACASYDTAIAKAEGTL